VFFTCAVVDTYNIFYVTVLFRSSKTVQVDNVDYNTKLVIRPVQRGDSGEYTVTASNSSGKDTVTVNVIVTDKPTSPEGPLQVLYFCA
jgi:hypothetical protein